MKLHCLRLTWATLRGVLSVNPQLLCVEQRQVGLLGSSKEKGAEVFLFSFLFIGGSSSRGNPWLLAWHAGTAVSELPPHLLTSCSFTPVSKRCLQFPEESMSIPVFPAYVGLESLTGRTAELAGMLQGALGRESSLLVLAPFRLKSPRIKSSAEFCPEWRPQPGAWCPEVEVLLASTQEDMSVDSEKPCIVLRGK